VIYVVIALLLCLCVSVFLHLRPQPTTAYVVVRPDQGKNPRWNWYLCRPDGSTMAMGSGSHAEKWQAEAAAQAAIGKMRSVQLVEYITGS